MKKWQCVVCGFVYDEEVGMPEDGIAPSTAWSRFRAIGNVRIAAWPRPTSRWSKWRSRARRAIGPYFLGGN